MEELIYKYIKIHKNTLIVLFVVLFASLTLHYLQNFFKEGMPLSLDQMIPKDFVLIPIAIQNSEDILPFMGNRGVINLYSYSLEKDLPQEVVALSLKVIPPLREDSRFSAIVPEKKALQLFQHEGPFYAVIQNPNKQGLQIMKKKIKRSLTIIEGEVFNEND